MTNATDPIAPYLNPKGMVDTSGLTKREYFAAMAMSGLLAYGRYHENIANDSVKLADTLITALNTNH